MDVATHAVSGAAVMLALPRRPATALSVPSAMIVAALPDIDVLFSRAPVDFLLLHRGITHALPALPFEALLCALLMRPLWKRGAQGAWSFTQCALCAFCLLLLHVWLDCATTYGTQIFLPFSDYRVRLNGLFIVDLLLLLPLIAACFAARRQPRIAALAVIWMLLYSGGAVAWRARLEHRQLAVLQSEGISPEQLTVLPDVFSPLYWKVQYAQGMRAFQAPLAWDGSRRGPRLEHRRADPALLARLAREDRSARIWSSFSLLPLQDEEIQTAAGSRAKEYHFYDWRFGSLVPFAQRIQNRRKDGATPFKFSARLDETGKLVAVRYAGSAGGGDSAWTAPRAPAGRSGFNRLIGLDD